MGPAAALVGLVALSLLVVGATLSRTGRASRTRLPPFRRAVPGIVGSMLIAAAVLAALPGVPPVVIAGVVAYTGFAVAAMWRLVSLDHESRWMLPSHRRARMVFSAIGLAWLGIVLGLLLRLADLVARASGT